MAEACPQCGARLRRNRTRHVGSLIEHRRDCRPDDGGCGYGDKILCEPERVVRIVPVVRRRKAASPQTIDTPLN